MTHEYNGTKAQVILWLLGLIQLVFLGLGTYVLSSTTENQAAVKVLEAKHANLEQTHIKDMGTVKESVDDLKKTVDKMNGNVEEIKMILIKRGQ